MYIGNKQIDTLWNWYNEVQYRSYDVLTDTDQLLIRTGLGYNLSRADNVHLGIAYLYSEPYIAGTSNKSTTQELRIYQQYTHRQPLGALALLHRGRFEQRFLDNNFSLRLRYYLSANLALNSQQIAGGTWYISAFNEVFLNTVPDYFDRNRIFGGVGYCFSKVLRTELGFMNQTTSAASKNYLLVLAFVTF